MAGGDVDDAHRLAARAQAPHRVAQQLLDVPLALPDAAPADRFEVDAVDEPADRRAPARFVPVDVVERAARIEAGLVAEANALGEEAAEAQPRARRAPVEAARGERGQRQRQARRPRPRVNPRRCAIARSGRAGARVEELEQEAPHVRERLRAVLLAERVVEEARQHVLLLVRRAEAVEERVLRRVVRRPSPTPEMRSCVGSVIAAASATIRSDAS